MSDIYLGDCREVRSVLADNSIDLIVTSPPYDNLRTYGGVSEWSFEVFKEVATALVAVLKAGGVIVWIVNDATFDGSETGTSFRQALYFKESGLNLHDTMIWEKSGIGVPCKTRYHACFEYMFVFCKGELRTFNPLNDRPNMTAGRVSGGKRTARKTDGTIITQSSRGITPETSKRRNIWSVTQETAKERTAHPAVFPLQLAEDHIKSWSNPGDTVLDPFSGSGTTLLAAKNTGREYVGIEQNPDYFAIIKARLGLA